MFQFPSFIKTGNVVYGVRNTILISLNFSGEMFEKLIPNFKNENNYLMLLSTTLLEVHSSYQHHRTQKFFLPLIFQRHYNFVNIRSRIGRLSVNRPVPPIT